jgi:putative transposase
MGRKKAHTPEEIGRRRSWPSSAKSRCWRRRARRWPKPCGRSASPSRRTTRWRAEFGGLKLDQVKRLKELERENARLRKAVSDLTLEKVILKEAASGKW